MSEIPPDRVPGPSPADAQIAPAAQTTSDAQAPSTPPPAAAPQSAEITIDDFARVELRVAKVLEAGPHPNAERLLKLKIDVGGEERQLIAGIAAHYRPEDLIGRSIVIVANLKPAKLRGELSQGMLLAAGDGETVSLLTPDKAMASGAKIR